MIVYESYRQNQSGFSNVMFRELSQLHERAEYINEYIYIFNKINKRTTIRFLHLDIGTIFTRVFASRSAITTFHCAFLHVFSLEFFACCGNVLALCFN